MWVGCWMPGFLTRDQELITPKVTLGTSRLALTETPERRREIADERVREGDRKRAVKSQIAWDIHGDEEKELREKKKGRTDTHKQKEKGDGGKRH